MMPTSATRLNQMIAVAMACCALFVVAQFRLSSPHTMPPISESLAGLIPPLTPYDMPSTELNTVVDDISRTEKWFQSLKHAYIRTRSTRTQSMQTVQRTLTRLQQESPGYEFTPADFPELMPVSQSKKLIAFDQHRIAFREEGEFSGVHLGQWDGEKMIGVRDPAGPQEVNYYYKANVEDCSFQLFHYFPMACNDSFWFLQRQPASFKASNLKCAGRLEFCGHDCVVLRTCATGRNVDWIIGRTNHRIHGRIDGTSVWEFGNHREVEENVFWPMRETYSAFSDRSPNSDERRFSFKVETTLDEFDTQNPPLESVYDFQLVKGTKVCDFRFDAMGVYPYDSERTANEWQKIKADIDERSVKKSDRSKVLEAMVGTEAVEFGDGRWLNSNALTFAGLRGTTVRLGFAFVNCGPCANMLSEFSRHQTRENVVHIIVFSAADSAEAVAAKMAKYKLNCPAFIPAPSNEYHMGKIVKDFAIEAFPTVVEINVQGRITTYSGLFNDSAY